MQVFNNYPQTFSIVGKFQGTAVLLTNTLINEYKTKYGKVNNEVIKKEQAKVLKAKQDKEQAIKVIISFIY